MIRFGIALSLMIVSAAGAAQEEKRVRLSSAQASAAGITTFRVGQVASAGEDPAGLAVLRLAGTVVVPSRLLEIVSAPLAGTVRSIAVDNMQRVSAGRAVVILDSPQSLEWQREFLQQFALAKSAEAKLAREERLFKEDIIAESRLQEAKSAYSVAAVGLQERRKLLRLAGLGESTIDALAASKSMNLQATISAPASGLVLEQMVNLGQRVEAGAPLLKIARDGTRWVELTVARDQLPQLRIGDAVSVVGCKASGRLIALAGQVQATSQAVLARAEFLNGSDCLKPNQHVEVGLSTIRAGEPGFIVPATAVLRHHGKDYVFVRRADSFIPVALEGVTQADGRAVVRGPLAIGMEVVDKGVAALKGAWLGIGEAVVAEPAPAAKGAR
jgi:RND family efflux transporter MFP subunit